MSTNLKADDFLYRAIKMSIPEQWKVDRPSSAVFKDSKGISVDVEDGRSLDEVTDLFQKRFELKALLRLSVSDCIDLGLFAHRVALPDNAHHAEIHRTQTIISLTQGQARRLVKLAEVVKSF